MGKLLNYLIGILIILFFVSCGWALIKSSAFVNTQVEKAKKGSSSLMEKAGATGETILQAPQKVLKKITAEDIQTSEETDKKETLLADATIDSATEKSSSNEEETSNTKGETKAKTPSDVPQEYDADSSKKSLKSSAADKTSNPSKAPFLIIAGSFTQADNAQKEVARLKKQGYTKAEALYLGSSKYLSIIAERSFSKKEAKLVVAKLKKQGIEAYVHTRR